MAKRTGYGENEYFAMAYYDKEIEDWFASIQAQFVKPPGKAQFIRSALQYYKAAVERSGIDHATLQPGDAIKAAIEARQKVKA